eukprot:jgi/Botrbrau1/13713/Bobra.250_2s0010.1
MMRKDEGDGRLSTSANDYHGRGPYLPKHQSTARPEGENYYDWTSSLHHPEVSTPGRTPLRLGPPQRTPILRQGRETRTRTLGGRNHLGVTPGSAVAMGSSQEVNQPLRKVEQRGNAFSRLPNILSTEYWLRKAKIEEDKGDIQAALGTLEEAMRRDVRPSSYIEKAMDALKTRGVPSDAPYITVRGGQSDTTGTRKPLETSNDPVNCNHTTNGVLDTVSPMKPEQRRKSQVRFATPEQHVVIPLSTPGPRGVNSCNAGSTPYHSGPNNRLADSGATPESQYAQEEGRGGENPASRTDVLSREIVKPLEGLSKRCQLPKTPTMFKPGHQSTSQWLGLSDERPVHKPYLGLETEEGASMESPALSVQINPMFNLTPSSVSSEETARAILQFTPVVSKAPPLMRKATPIGIPNTFKSFVSRTHFLSPGYPAPKPRSRLADSSNAVKPSQQESSAANGHQRDTMHPQKPPLKSSQALLQPVHRGMESSSVNASGVQIPNKDVYIGTATNVVSDPRDAITTLAPSGVPQEDRPLGSPIFCKSGSLKHDVKHLDTCSPVEAGSSSKPVIPGDSPADGQLGSPITFLPYPPQEHDPPGMMGSNLPVSLAFGSPMQVGGSPHTPANILPTPANPPLVPHVLPLDAPPTPDMDNDGDNPYIAPSTPDVSRDAKPPATGCSWSAAASGSVACNEVQQSGFCGSQGGGSAGKLEAQTPILFAGHQQEQVSSKDLPETCDTFSGPCNLESELSEGTGESDSPKETSEGFVNPPDIQSNAAKTPLSVGRPLRIADPLGRSGSRVGVKEVRGIMQSPKKLLDQANMGSCVRLSPVRAPPKLRGLLGSSTVITPVRRSARKSHAATPVAKLLRNTKYSYTPNVALESHLPGNLPQQLNHCPPPPPPTPSDALETATEVPILSEDAMKSGCLDADFVSSLTAKLSSITLVEKDHPARDDSDQQTATKPMKINISQTAPLELADVTNIDPPRHGAPVSKKPQANVQKEDYPLHLSPTEARIREGVRRSSRLQATGGDEDSKKQGIDRGGIHTQA